MSTSQPFYLTALDNDVDVLKALVSGTDSSIETKQVPKVRAKLNVQLEDVKNIFKYATNSVDLNDLSGEDIYFLVDADGFRDLPVATDSYNVSINNAAVSGSLNGEKLVDEIGSAYVYEAASHTDANLPKSGIDFERDVKGQYYAVDNKGMIKDLFRDLANQMFNTQYGVDIFSNETDLCNNTYTSTSNLLKSGGAIWNKLNDASGLHIGSMDAADNDDNIGKILLENIISKDPIRLQDLSSNFDTTISMESDPDNLNGVGAAGGNNSEMRVYKMPFITGDSLHFHLTYNYDGDQGDVVNATGTVYEPRIYEVVLMIV
jgi:hypothetical protein